MQHPLYNIDLKPTLYSFDEDQLFDQLGFCYLPVDWDGRRNRIFFYSNIPFFEKINIQRFSCDNYLWAEDYSLYLYNLIKPFNNSPNSRFNSEEIFTDNENETLFVSLDILKEFNYNIDLPQGEFLFTWLNTDYFEFTLAWNQGIVITKQSLILSNPQQQKVNFFPLFYSIKDGRRFNLCANSLRCFKKENNEWIEFYPDFGKSALYRDIETNFNHAKIALEQTLETNFNRIFYQRNGKTFINYNCFPKQKYLKKIAVTCDFSEGGLSDEFTDYNYIFEDIPQYLKEHCYLHYANNNYWNYKSEIRQDLGVSFDEIRLINNDFYLDFNHFNVPKSFSYDISKFRLNHYDDRGFFYEINKQLFYQYHAGHIYPKYQIPEVINYVDEILPQINDDTFTSGDNFTDQWKEIGQDILLVLWYFAGTPQETYHPEYHKDFDYFTRQNYAINEADYRKFNPEFGFLDPSGDKPFFVNQVSFSRLSKFGSSAEHSTAEFLKRNDRSESYYGDAFYNIKIKDKIGILIENLSFKTFEEKAFSNEIIYTVTDTNATSQTINLLTKNEQTINISETLEFFVEFNCYSEQEFYDKLKEQSNISKQEFINNLIQKYQDLKEDEMYLALEQIKNALNAGKYANYVDSNGDIRPSEKGLGWHLMALARWKGISFNLDGSIRPIRQRSHIQVKEDGRTFELPENYYIGQIGVEEADGLPHDPNDPKMNGGIAGEERLTAIYRQRSNKFKNFDKNNPDRAEVTVGDYIGCETEQQYFASEEEDLDKMLGCSELAAGVMPSADGSSYSIFEGLGEAVAENSHMLSALAQNIYKIQVMTIQNYNFLTTLIRGSGLPIATQLIKVDLGIKDNLKNEVQGNIPVAVFNENEGMSLTEQNFAILENIATLLGTQLEIPTEDEPTQNS